MKPRYVFSLIVILFLSLYAQLSMTTDRASSYSSQVYGARAFYLMLERLEKRAEPWLYPFVELEAEESGAAMIVASPTSFAGGQDLLNWVENGNRLLLLTGNTELLSQIFKKAKIEFSDYSFLDQVSDEPLTGIRPKCPEEVREVCLAVGEVSRSRQSFKPGALATAVAQDDKGVSIYRWAHGKGDIWFFSGDDVMVNAEIDRYDNLRLLYQLVSGMTIVRFDEFHHGHRAPVAMEQERRYESFWVLIGLLMFLLLTFTLSRAIRFGPMNPELEHSLPGSSEFVTALGVLFQEHNARSTLKHYIDAWKERASQQFGISVNLDDAAFVEALAKGKPFEAGSLRSAVVNLRAGEKSRSSKQDEQEVLLLESILG